MKKPTRNILIFALVLGAVYAATQLHLTGGKPVQWSTNLDESLARAAGDKRRVLLLLHEKGDRDADRADREFFTQRAVRSVLSELECVRIELRPDVIAHLRVREKYGFQGRARLVVLDSNGTAVSSTEAPFDEKNFRTYISNFAQPPDK